jgi:hypothetical protein
MPRYYFDVAAGPHLFRDAHGVEYDDLDSARRDMRSVLVELAGVHALIESNYELTVREELRPLCRARLMFSEELLSLGDPSLQPIL